ncbi:MAG: RsmB/NOP family class I SAM-dependent RNA methyltransferase [Flavobacteriales bacterium]|nr:RsmB/NOP family class I SAM-dependent RNA methyltransferase [Flavobacteriales bacterium]
MKDPHYHAGDYYPQEASSMVIGEIVKRLSIDSTSFCLDLCAAPGGKSINLLQALPSDSFLIAKEVIRSRVRVLIESLRKWGSYNVGIASIHPKEWINANELFDLILVDAPCSGEGMFRKQESKAISEWSMDNVRFCAERQKSIIDKITPCIKKGGYLIYSTCTYSEAENGDMIEKIVQLGLEPEALAWPSDHDFVSIGGYQNAFQAYPHKVRGEGLFFSVFRKPGRCDTVVRSSEKKEIWNPIPMRIPAGFFTDRE